MPYYTPDQQAAAEYLTAFIKLFISRGKCSYEIADKLEIHTDLIKKLLKGNKTTLEALERRDREYIEKIKASCATEAELTIALRKHNLSHYPFNDTYYDYRGYLKNVEPWQNRNRFKNGIDFYFRDKKRYSEADIDVLARLSMGTVITEPKDKFRERDLLPEHKFRLINDILDGHGVVTVSEKYNCSQLAVMQTAEEKQLTVPAGDETVRKRVVQAIKDGYTFEQLTMRFNFAEELIKELIIKYRIEPVMNGGSNSEG